MKQKAQDSITAAWAFFNQQKLIKSLLTYIFYKVTFPSRSVGLPPLSPSRTVHATFTAHGSCNSVNYFSF